jgi:hypothetical protein
MLAEAARLEAGEPGIRARLDAASAGEAAAMPWRLRSDVRAGYGFEVFDGGRIGFGVRYRLVTGGRLKADEGWLDLRPLRPGEDGPSALEASLRSCRLL